MAYLLITTVITLSKNFNIYSTKCIPCGKEEVFNYLFVLEVHSPKKIKFECPEFLSLSVQIAFSPRLLSDNIKIKIYKITILPIFMWVFVLVSRRRKVFQNRLLRIRFGLYVRKQQAVK